MGEPTAKERILLTKFRNKMMPFLETEEQRSAPFLIRWIRARDHDLAKAETMLKTALKYRKENKLDDLRKRRWDDFFPNCLPYHADGVDREGRLVVTYDFGKWDVKKAVELGLVEELSDYFISQLELVLDKAKENRFANSGWPASQIVAVVNCDGYTLSNFLAGKSAMSIFVRRVRHFETLYPETMFQGLFINCSKTLHMFHALTRFLIPQKTRTKMTHLGTKKEQWLPLVHSLVDPAQIRLQFGGTKKD